MVFVCRPRSPSLAVHSGSSCSDAGKGMTPRTALVLATVPDRHFVSGSGSKPNRCQIGGLRRH